MMTKAHPMHDLEWRDSSHYEFVCKNRNKADSTAGWGALAEPCEKGSLIDSAFVYSAYINNGRTLQDIVSHLTTEVGEFTQEV